MGTNNRNWQVTSFQSGTVIVEDKNSKYMDSYGGTFPHYYVYGPRGAGDSIRHEYAQQLADYLNNRDIKPTNKPKWIKKLSRTSDQRLENMIDGSNVYTIGPYINTKPDEPYGEWKESMTEQAISDRKLLIDWLVK